jgi:hypothetical protein
LSPKTPRKEIEFGALRDDSLPDDVVADGTFMRHVLAGGKVPDRVALIPVDHDPFREPLEAGGDDAGRYAPLPRPAVRRAERPRKTPTGSYKDKTVCVIDNGLFVEMAVRLADEFGTVYYYAPWEYTFPKTNRMLLGAGIPNVRKIDSFWPFLNDIDLFVFPDVNFGPLQLHLVWLGKRVWGSRSGEELEQDRAWSKQHLASIGVDIGDYAVITGMTALRDYLQTHEDQYVKISRTRGDMESFHSKNYDLIEPLLDDLEHKFGPKKNLIEFIVEEAIPDAVEIGYDGWTIDGQFPQHATAGIETKDKGFVMKTGNYADLPEPLRDINTKLAPTFRNFQYRGFFSDEVRLTKDGKAYLIDPTCRAPSPPSQLYWMMIKNWGDIIWNGAEGSVVEPDFADKWGAELILLSDWATENWQPIEFPDEIREHVRITNLTMIDGKYFFVPQGDDMPQIGGVVALGDTMEAAIKAVKEIAEQVDGYCVETTPDALDAAKEQIEKLKEFGITL